MNRLLYFRVGKSYSSWCGGRLAERSPLGSGSPSFSWMGCKIDITVLSVLTITKKQLLECHTCSDTWLCYDYYAIHKFPHKENYAID